MSLKVDQGLFSLDFIDHHAILGVPVDADIKEFRKHYLKIARRLHPDSFTMEDSGDRQRAVDLLSKLVNPAYEKLSNERNYTEYCILLRLKGQHALRQQETVVLVSDVARRLAAASDLDNAYRAGVRGLFARQYEDLSQTLDVIGQISELNLVYLMRKEGRGESAISPGKSQSSATATASPSIPKVQPPAQPATPPRESVVESYLRRAQEFESKQDYGKAIQELREAIQLDAANSNCHSRLGIVYLKTNQITMAKIHFNQALKLNPNDSLALEGKRRVEPSSESKSATVAKKADPKGAKPDKSGGGLFGMFGGKKK
ncbi:J domain-containing protein [Oculatella sp. LEGE 06141]|uniref:J domain-containing protein n=1 Tax=Oculatella sp. LEGE 06141 TaxID=1828648 RepID=UPI00187E5C57|nr:J domain-containing protein [Oculatella sp. LEGE 06141]MBE9181218.1 J domain-containing protein [Oculatella sp. LEGE 06141]